VETRFQTEEDSHQPDAESVFPAAARVEEFSGETRVLPDCLFGNIPMNRWRNFDGLWTR
jgi:hypothetical protein